MPWFALLGSGEFEPWTKAIDRWLLEHGVGDGRILVLPTASAPEGDSVFLRWATMGLEHYAQSGIAAEVVPIKTRVDAASPHLVDCFRGASAVFFSGGTPAYLAATLMGTPAWEAIREELDRGMAYGGCSAGVASLGEAAPDSSIRDPLSADGELLQPGLNVFPGTYFMPHWDALESYIPGLQGLVRRSVPAGRTLMAIDERTAVLGNGSAWTVAGSGSVHVIHGPDEQVYGPDSAFTEPILEGASDGRGGGAEDGS